jgi:hypothetical protein
MSVIAAFVRLLLTCRLNCVRLHECGPDVSAQAVVLSRKMESLSRSDKHLQIQMEFFLSKIMNSENRREFYWEKDSKVNLLKE